MTYRAASQRLASATSQCLGSTASESLSFSSLQDVDLSSIQPYLEDEAESRHDHREWQFHYGQRAFLLRARSEDARDEWVAALTAAVAQAKAPTRPEQA